MLIIDDNEAILHVLGRILTKQGYNVETARTGNEALEKLSERSFQLAIIDLDLPDMNGFELHKIIGTRSPATKRIILTGLPPKRDLEHDSIQEPLRILMKPLTGEELVSAVKKALDSDAT
ncbi:MAG: response regulator [Candidatus Bathyarchaeia archaeon]